MIDVHDNDALWGLWESRAGTAGTSGSDRPQDFHRATVPPPDTVCDPLVPWLTPPPAAPRDAPRHGGAACVCSSNRHPLSAMSSINASYPGFPFCPPNQSLYTLKPLARGIVKLTKSSSIDP